MLLSEMFTMYCLANMFDLYKKRIAWHHCVAHSAFLLNVFPHNMKMSTRRQQIAIYALCISQLFLSACKITIAMKNKSMLTFFMHFYFVKTPHAQQAALIEPLSIVVFQQNYPSMLPKKLFL